MFANRRNLWIALALAGGALVAAALACNAPGADATAGPDDQQARSTLTLFIDPTLLTPATTPDEGKDATDEPEATPTEPPTPTGCGYWSTFIDDVTIPDGTEVPAGEAFEKTWEIRNTGCLAWDPNTELVFLEGDQMGGPDSMTNIDSVQPTQNTEVTVELTAPLETGEYTGYWQLISPGQISVGPPVFVQITVVEAQWQRFAGEWQNGDANTENIAKLEIRAEDNQLVIHRYDVCDTGICDVGEVSTALTDADDGILNLLWTGKETGGTTATKNEPQLISILGDGRLQVIGQVDYVDEEAEDFTYTEYFIKP
jgi:hypothetical protein